MTTKSEDRHDEVIRKTNESLIFRIVLKGGQQGASLLLGILLARFLSPEEFGVIAIANIVITYANNFTNFGLNSALVQKDEINNIHLNTVFTIDIGISLFLLIATVLTADQIAYFFHNPGVAPVLKWMSLYYVITSFYYIPVVILRRDIDFRFLTVTEFFQSIVTSLIAITLSLYGFSYWSIVIPSIIIPAIVAIVLIIKIQWIPRLMIGRNMGEIYSFGIWNFIRTQVQLIVSKIDYFVIGRYLDVRVLGLYEKSFELTERAMTGLTMPVNSIFFSTFSRLKKDLDKVKNIFLEASSLLSLICYPVLLGLVGVAPHFVMSCLGPKWEGAIRPIELLSIASMFRVLLGLVASVNLAVGNYKIHTIINIVAAFFFFIGCFWIVDYGIVSMCYLYICFCLLSFVLSFWIVHRAARVGMIELCKALWYPVMGSLVMLVILLMMRYFVFRDYTSILELFYLIVIGIFVYGAWCYFCYRLGKISVVIGKFA